MVLLEDFAKVFLSEWVVEHFDIVRVENSSTGEQIDVWLDEKETVPDSYTFHEVIAYGFTPASTLQDFPVRGKAVFLHIRRRKWQIVKTGRVVTQNFDLSHQGTRLTKELVAFLKATN